MSWVRRKYLWAIPIIVGLTAGIVTANVMGGESDQVVQAQSHPMATASGPARSPEEIAREWQKRLEGYRADRGLEGRNAHPGSPHASGDQISVNENVDLTGFHPPALDIGWNEGRGMAIVRIVMRPAMYNQFLDKLGLDHSVDPTRLVMSEATAAQMISLHEVYAQLFTASNGRNPDTISYCVAVDRKTTIA